MKFKFEVELDWVAAENGLDEEIKARLIEQVVNEALKKIGDSVEKESGKIISEKIDTHIQGKLEELLTRNIIIANKFGAIEKRYESINELMEEKFDNFLTTPVDKNGKPVDGCSYGAKSTRIEHYVEGAVSSKVKEFAEKAVMDAERKVKSMLTENIKAKITQKLAAQFDLGDILAVAG